MPLGLIILFILAALVLFGAAHRVLDRMRLTDTQALIVLGLIFVGSFVDIPLSRGRTSITVNVGGVLVPTALAIYLLARAGTAMERTRAIIGALVTAGIVWGISQITDFGPHGGTPMMLDPLWLFALVGGIVAYVLGRSRRAAFVAGVLGIVLFQLLDVFINSSAAGRASSLALGGGGFFDAIVLSGIISVGLAEVVGETRERLQGGPDLARPEPLKQALTNHPDDGSGGRPYEDGGDSSHSFSYGDNVYGDGQGDSGGESGRHGNGGGENE